MEKVSKKKQIFYKFCSFIPIILVLVLPSFFFFFLVSNFSLTLLTTLVALFSTMFLVKLTRKKVSLDKNQVQNNFQKLESQSSLGDYVDVTQNEVTKGSDNEDAKRYHEKQQGEEAQKIDSSFPSDNGKCCKFSVMDKSLQLNAIAEEYDEQHIADPNSDSSSLPSDSESGTSSIKSEGFENDFRRNQNLGISEILAYDYDDDDDDEEEEDSLIEIKLPNSNYFGLDGDEDPKYNLESNNLPEFFPESIFKHKGLMELLEEINEINEDENLIEIDLSIGSTKCHQDLRVNQELEYYGDQCVLSD